MTIAPLGADTETGEITGKTGEWISGLAIAKVNPLEGVAFFNYGDSYGDGTQGADQNSRPFNRLAARHRTLGLTMRAQAGKRMDEIAQRILDTWVPNSRGLIGFSDGVINDLKQYANDTARTTTREAFRSCLAMLTAKSISTITSQAVAFDGSWVGGVTSTAGARVNVAVTAPKVYLLVGFYDTEGGTLTVKRSGTTIATINTNGYARDFIGAYPISGLTGTTELNITVDSGTARIYGVAVPSTYPPVIVWDKPGRYSTNATEAARLTLYLAECAGILGDFPSVVPVDMGPDWDYTKMIGVDATHRNDYGNMFAADRIDTALQAFLGGEPRQGLNRLILANSELGADVAYVTPTATPLVVVVTYAADNFDRADGAAGNTPVGNKPWVARNGAAINVLSNQGATTVTAGGSGTPNGAGHAATVDAGQANGTVSLVKKVTVGGIVFRARLWPTVGTDPAEGYVFWPNGGVYELRKKTAGATYTVVATTSVVPATNDLIEVVMNGTAVKIRVNGAVAWQGTLTDYASNTEHGWFSTTAGTNLFDNYSQTDQVV